MRRRGICKCASVFRRRRDGSSRKYAKEAKNPLTRLCRGLSQRESLNLSRKALKEKGLTLSSVAGTKALHNQNTLTFEPKAPSFTAITLTGQKSSALNFSREFLRECVPQIAFFRTFFSKKKVHKGKAFAESPSRRRLQTLAHLQIPPVFIDIKSGSHKIVINKNHIINKVKENKKMQLFVLILNKTECMHGILAGFLAGGIKDATIYDSMGMLSYIGHDTVEPPPMFGSLRQFLNPDHENNKTLVTLLRDDQVKIALDIINKETGGLDKPKTGVAFTVPVSYTEGLKG